MQDGWTALHLLCGNPGITLQALEALLDAGSAAASEVDKEGLTPLHELCSNGAVTPAAIRALVKASPASAAVEDEVRIMIVG
jgi:ankyrin repeat protein